MSLGDFLFRLFRECVAGLDFAFRSRLTRPLLSDCQIFDPEVISPSPQALHFFGLALMAGDTEQLTVR